MRAFTAICVLIITGALAVGLTLNGYNHIPPAPDTPTYDHPPPLVSQPGLVMAGPYRNPHRRTVRYRITTLHHTSDDEPMHLNNSGDILCGTDFYHDGRWTRLKAKLSDGTIYHAETDGLNDSGVIVGDLVSEESGAYTIDYSAVVVWQNGRMRELPNQPSDRVTAVAINSRGNVLTTTAPASRMEPDQTSAAYLYSEGHFFVVSPGAVCCFNDKDQVVLQADAGSGFSLWERGKSLPLSIPTGQQTISVALINNHAHLTGAITTGETTHAPYQDTTQAFLWQQGWTRVLGTLGGDDSTALGLNNGDQVVGKADTYQRTKGGEAVTRAFLWRDGKMQDLNDLIPAHTGWVLAEADAINDRGQIVGVGNKGTFLLTPVGR